MSSYVSVDTSDKPQSQSMNVSNTLSWVTAESVNTSGLINTDAVMWVNPDSTVQPVSTVEAGGFTVWRFVQLQLWCQTKGDSPQTRGPECVCACVCECVCVYLKLDAAQSSAGDRDDHRHTGNLTLCDKLISTYSTTDLTPLSLRMCVLTVAAVHDACVFHVWMAALVCWSRWKYLKNCWMDFCTYRPP